MTMTGTDTGAPGGLGGLGAFGEDAGASAGPEPTRTPPPTPTPTPTPPGAIDLCPGGALPERGRAWVWDVLHLGRPVRAFALRHDGQVRAYLNRCVHVAAEMDWMPGEFLDSEQRFIICSIHGAAYEPATGRCVDGPCGRGRLTPVPVQELGRKVYWYPSAELCAVPETPAAAAIAAFVPPPVPPSSGPR